MYTWQRIQSLAIYKDYLALNMLATLSPASTLPYRQTDSQQHMQNARAITPAADGFLLCFLQALEHHRGVRKLRTYEHLSIGAFSGACAATATTPLDCAKTALQCGARAPLGEVLRCIVREHGPRGLFAGMVRTTALSFINAAFVGMNMQSDGHCSHAGLSGCLVCRSNGC